MARFQLSSEARTDLSKSAIKKVRNEGRIPATVYGKGDEPKSISVPGEDFSEILRAPGGKVSLVELTSDSTPETVVIRDMQRDPITKDVIHIDFQRVKMDEPVCLGIPVTPTGDSPGVKLGGVLSIVMPNVEIKALPESMPTHVNADISSLEIGQNIKVGQLTVPEGAQIVSDPAAIVVAVRAASRRR